MDLTWHKLKVVMLLSSYNKMLTVSKAQVLSASNPDFSDIITLQASGVPERRNHRVSIRSLRKTFTFHLDQ